MSAQKRIVAQAVDCTLALTNRRRDILDTSQPLTTPDRNTVFMQRKRSTIFMIGLYLCRQRPTLPHTFACSNIRRAALNFVFGMGTEGSRVPSKHLFRFLGVKKLELGRVPL